MAIDATPGREVPWPPPWGKPKPTGGIVGAVLWGAVALVGVFAGLSALDSGTTDPIAYVLVALIPFFTGLALLSAVLRMRTRTRGTGALRSTPGRVGPQALSIPFRRSLVFAFWLTTVGALPVLMLLTATSLSVTVTATPVNPVALISAVLLVLIALSMLLLVIDGLRGKAPRGELRLSQNGVLYRAMSYDAWVPWHAIEAVSVNSGDGQPIVITGYRNTPPQLSAHSWLLRPGKRLAAQASESMLTIRGLGLAVDPATVLYTLRFYHANQAARAELGSQTSVERVHRGGTIPTE